MCLFCVVSPDDAKNMDNAFAKPQKHYPHPII